MSARDRYQGLPLSEPLLDFMDKHREFEQSLKLASTRFDFLGRLITSHPPSWHTHSSDQVIGFWYLDKQKCAQSQAPRFKQDFIVNVGSNSEFVSYVDKKRLKQAGQSPFVRPIGDFFGAYGDKKQMIYMRAGAKPWAHHYADVEDLPSELQEFGERLKRACLGH